MSLSDIKQTFEHALKEASQWTPEELARMRAGQPPQPKPPIVYNKPLEGRPMAAPPTIRNFAGTLRDHLKRATDRMEKMAKDFGDSVDNLHHRLDETDAVRKDVDSASREIQEVIGTPNGGPSVEK